MATEFNTEIRQKLAANRPEVLRENKRQGGRIESWTVTPSVMNPEHMVIRGMVHDDPYWPYGPIRTSLIVSVNDDETEVETLNTIYQLGVKAE